jgi:hypothetical protein
LQLRDAKKVLQKQVTVQTKHQLKADAARSTLPQRHRHSSAATLLNQNTAANLHLLVYVTPPLVMGEMLLGQAHEVG